MGEWKEYILEDVIERFIDYRGKTPTKTSSGIPLVTAKIVKSGSIEKPTEFIAEKDYDDWMTRGFPEKDDVVLTTEAPLGEVALLKDPNVALAQRIITLRGKPDLVFNPFLKYYLQSSIGQYKLRIRASGSTVSGIKSSVLKKTVVDIPSLQGQKLIANVLLGLDAKIDLLRQQNETLEALGAAVFREWFLGGNWQETSLYDQIQLIGGGTPKTGVDEYWGGEIGWLSGGDIASNHKGYVSGASKTVTKDGVANSSTKLLPRSATIISARGTVGKYCLLAEPMTFSQSNYGVMPADGTSFYFTYLLIDHAVDRLLSAAYGSVFDTITTRTFKNLKLPAPPAMEVHKFEQKVSPFFEKMATNTKSINNLIETRDLLLPKLMSGKVKITQ